MAAPAEMPHADEALKSLVARFKEDPGSSAFTELAAALLARGHASEALRIAEHGLQVVPDDVEGRIERAAALLALGRPRVAFVELKRALAINPTNRRAMRLLGKVYVDAGAPGKAAELLKQRFQPEEQEPTHVTQAPVTAFSENEGTDLELAAPPGAQSGQAGWPQGGASHAGAQGARDHGSRDGVGARDLGPARDTLIPREDTQPLPRKPPVPERPTHPTPQGTPAGNGAPRTSAGANGGAAQAQSAQAAGDRGGQRTSAVAHASTVGAIPDLFSDLTRDLGLGVAVPEAPQSRVEVTQIIRRKKDRVPRSPSELAMIEGPIVDTTQPGQITENTGDVGDGGPVALMNEPPPLFEASTSPRLQLAPAFGLDDEPLFQEHMPFEVRPVGDAGSAGEPPSDLRETLDEDVPPELDRALRAALDGASKTGAPAHGRLEGNDTLVDGLEESSAAPESVNLATAPDLVPRGLADDAGDGLRFEAGAARPFLEVSRPSRRAAGAVKLDLVVPKAKPRDVVLAAVGAVVMIISLVVFVLSAPAAWKSSPTGVRASSSFGHEGRAAAGSKSAAASVDDGAGTRAQQ